MIIQVYKSVLIFLIYILSMVFTSQKWYTEKIKHYYYFCSDFKKHILSWNSLSCSAEKCIGVVLKFMSPLNITTKHFYGIKCFLQKT